MLCELTGWDRDPFEEHRSRPLLCGVCHCETSRLNDDRDCKACAGTHVSDFREVLLAKNNTARYVSEVVQKIRVVIAGCKWNFIDDRSASRVQSFLLDLRRGGLGPQTSNHYLRAIKQFSRWLVQDRRTNDDPLSHLSMIDVKTDRRHDRRALSSDEFACLIEAARSGKRVESIYGEHRAMMYILSAWTGYRKKEIGSLTLRSFQLAEQPYTVTVQAGYSKRRRKDIQVLHPAVAELLNGWLGTQSSLRKTDLLFPVSGEVPGGTERKTAKMMRTDLESARNKWIEEAEDEVDRNRRLESNFLTYCDSEGLFADFHANRHTFITNLSKARVLPKVAQQLARHSDIRLTMDIYTHLELGDHEAAIESLPSPPLCLDTSAGASPQATETGSSSIPGDPSADPVVPTPVPKMVPNDLH